MRQVPRMKKLQEPELLCWKWGTTGEWMGVGELPLLLYSDFQQKAPEKIVFFSGASLMLENLS